MSNTGDKPRQKTGFKGKPGKPKQVLGFIPNLGDKVYKYGTKDQADAFLRTTRAVAEYVGVKFDLAMKQLVQYSKEKVFEEPQVPGDKAGVAELAKYKINYGTYDKEKKKYQEDKEKVFSIILGQYLPVVKNKLKSEGLEALEEDSDIVGLMTKLKMMAFNVESAHEPYGVLAEQLDKFTSIQQGEKERITNYHERFLAMKDVIEVQWGGFYPEVLAKKEKGAEAKKIATAQEKMLVGIFLRGSNNVDLKAELNNSYLSGNDKYPKTIDEALSLMMHYQDGKGKKNSETMISRDEEQIPASGHATSFAQVVEKRTCFKCGKKGHIARNCKDNNNNESSNYQGSVWGPVVSDTDNDD